MNEALRTPSPSRFWRKLGILNAALYASAATEVPRYRQKTLWRTSPARRLRRMPAATNAAPPLRAGPLAGAAGVAATSDAGVPIAGGHYNAAPRKSAALLRAARRARLPGHPS